MGNPQTILYILNYIYIYMRVLYGGRHSIKKYNKNGNIIIYKNTTINNNIVDAL